YVHLDGGSTTALLGFQNELSRLDRTPLGTETEQIPIERYQYFVAAALVLLLLSWIMPSRLPGLSFRGFRPGRRPALAALLLAVLIGGCTEDSLRQRNEAANDLYNAGAHEEALAEYQELISERPDVD